MGMGSANLDITDNSAAVKGATSQETISNLQKKWFGNTAAPPAAPSLDITDQRLAGARSAAALQLTAGQSRKESFATFGGGDAGLLARQQAVNAITAAKGGG